MKFAGVINSIEFQLKFIGNINNYILTVFSNI